MSSKQQDLLLFTAAARRKVSLALVAKASSQARAKVYRDRRQASVPPGVADAAEVADGMMSDDGMAFASALEQRRVMEMAVTPAVPMSVFLQQTRAVFAAHVTPLSGPERFGLVKTPGLVERLMTALGSGPIPEGEDSEPVAAARALAAIAQTLECAHFLWAHGHRPVQCLMEVIESSRFVGSQHLLLPAVSDLLDAGLPLPEAYALIPRLSSIACGGGNGPAAAEAMTCLLAGVRALSNLASPSQRAVFSDLFVMARQMVFTQPWCANPDVVNAAVMLLTDMVCMKCPDTLRVLLDVGLLQACFHLAERCTDLGGHALYMVSVLLEDAHPEVVALFLHHERLVPFVFSLPFHPGWHADDRTLALKCVLECFQPLAADHRAGPIGDRADLAQTLISTGAVEIVTRACILRLVTDDTAYQALRAVETVLCILPSAQPAFAELLTAAYGAQAGCNDEMTDE